MSPVLRGKSDCCANIEMAVGSNSCSLLTITVGRVATVGARRLSVNRLQWLMLAIARVNSSLLLLATHYIFRCESSKELTVSKQTKLAGLKGNTVCFCVRSYCLRIQTYLRKRKNFLKNSLPAYYFWLLAVSSGRYTGMKVTTGMVCHDIDFAIPSVIPLNRVFLTD